MKRASKLYGLLAEFARPDELLEAAHRARKAGYRNMDAYSPFPVEGLAEALGNGRSRVPMFVLTGAIIGGALGYFMQYYAMTIAYPLNVGGRPFHSWPSFIPITFELTILGGALSAALSALLLNRLPEPYHPVFNAPGFERASADRFFLCIETIDEQFDGERTRQFLEGLQPVSILEAPS